jgi:hypothetical protein
MTKNELVHLARAYNKGQKVRQIAAAMGYTQEHIYQQINVLRARGEKLPRRKPHLITGAQKRKPS